MKKHMAEDYVVSALKTLEESKITEVDEKLNRRAASFGPSIISIGVLPTIVYYDDQSDALKCQVLTDLWKIMTNSEKKYANVSGCKNLREYAVNRKDHARVKRECIMAAATAYKLALRTYPEKKQKEDKKKDEEGAQ